MWGLIQFLLLLQLRNSQIFAQEIEIENDVLVLTNDNFKKALEEYSMILVEFYAPWCGHCQALAPEYEKAAKTLAEQKSGTKLAKVDATKETNIAEQFDIEGYPTLKLFKNKNPSEYNGGRDADGILKWLEKKSGPQWKVVDGGALMNFKDKEEALVVAFMKDLDSKDATVFKEVADSFDELNFYFVTDPAVMKQYYQQDGSIVLMKNFDDEKDAIFTEKIERESLLKFVKTQSVPLIWEFTQENADKIFSSDIAIHFLLISDKNDGKYNDRMEEMKTVAKEHRGKIIFVHLHVEEEEAPDVMEFLGISKESCPTFVIFEIEASSKYLPAKENAQLITAENLNTFITDYFEGKIPKFLKSATLPDDWDKENVKVLVGSNFEEVTKDKTKDVFVKFYAPWCGHCKKIAPIWDELAESLKERSDLVMAKIDGVDNEVDGVDVDGFPTLVMVKKESNEKVTYAGKRDLESMKKFIETGEQEEAEEDEDDEDMEDEEPEDYPDDDGEDGEDIDLENDFDIDTDEEDEDDEGVDNRRIEL